MHYTKQKEHANTLILLQHHKYSSLSKHAYLFLINAIPTWTKVRTPTSNRCISDARGGGARGSPVCWIKYWPFQTVRSLIIVVVIKCFQDDKHRSNHILPQKHSQDSQQIIKLVTCVHVLPWTTLFSAESVGCAATVLRTISCMVYSISYILESLGSVFVQSRYKPSSGPPQATLLVVLFCSFTDKDWHIRVSVSGRE